MRKLIFLLLAFPMLALAGITEVDKQFVLPTNVIANGGFENGKAKWTASGGTFVIVTSGTNKLRGNASATWDSSAASQTLATATTAIPNGVAGRNGVAFCKIQTPSGSATHLLQVLDGSSNLLGSTTILSSTTPQFSYTNFVFPASGGSVVLQLKSVASDEPLIAIDDCFVADASEVNLSTISQAQFIGSAHIVGTTSCTWTTTSTTMASFGTTAACPGPTVDLNPGPGTIQTTDTDLPKFTVNNLPAGVFEVTWSGGASDTTTAGCMAISDGTTTDGVACASGSNVGFGLTGIAHFSYTGTGNRTFEIKGAAGAGTLTLDNSATPTPRVVTFSIKSFPASSSLVYKPDTGGPLSWSGYLDSTCSWARTNASYGDPTADVSCALVEKYNTNFGTVSTSGSVLPAISFTTKKQGKYWVSAVLNGVRCATTSATYAAELIDAGSNVIASATADCIVGGTGSQPITLTGIYNAPSAGFAETLKIQTKASSGAITLNAAGTDNAINWQIFSIDTQIPAPIMINTIVSSNNSGVEKLVRLSVTNPAGTASIGSQSGSWISSISRTATGSITINITAGTFSATQTCVCSVFTAASSASRECNIVTKTTSVMTTEIRTGGSTLADESFEMICMGPN